MNDRVTYLARWNRSTEEHDPGRGNDGARGLHRFFVVVFVADPVIRMNGSPHGEATRVYNYLDGAGDRNRTGDPVITSDVLYQLSYTSSRA